VKRHSVLAVALVMLLAAMTVSAYGKEKNKGDTGRMLTGKVIDKQDNPLTDSVVYLSNTRTRAVKTYIVGPDGLYHFPELSPNIDYEVYAQFNGQKSDTKTVSQFDDRKAVNLNLRIDTKK
jgi:Carboxypeptidase regulatory-like domain